LKPISKLKNGHSCKNQPDFQEEQNLEETKEVEIAENQPHAVEQPKLQVWCGYYGYSFFIFGPDNSIRLFITKCVTSK
jgi:hypothetical protein